MPVTSSTARRNARRAAIAFTAGAAVAAAGLLLAHEAAGQGGRTATALPSLPTATGVRASTTVTVDSTFGRDRRLVVTARLYRALSTTGRARQVGGARAWTVTQPVRGLRLTHTVRMAPCPSPRILYFARAQLSVYRTNGTLVGRQVYTTRSVRLQCPAQ